MLMNRKGAGIFVYRDIVVSSLFLDLFKQGKKSKGKK